MVRTFKIVGVGACLFTSTFAQQAQAQMSPIAVQPASAEPGSDESEAGLRRQLDQSNARIEMLERRLQILEAALLPNGTQRLNDHQESEMRGRGGGINAFTTQALADGSVAIIAQTAPIAAASTAPGAEGAPPDEEEDRKTPALAESVELVTEQQQKIFGDKLSLELGLTYTHFDNAALNLSGFLALDSIFLGRISLDQITSEVFIADATLRYGITDRLQIDVNVPYFYRHSNFTSGGAGGDASGLEEAGVTERGLGDINFGIGYRLFRETLRRPDVVLNARVKAPTGKSPWGVELVEVPGSLGNLKIPERLSTGSGVWGASFGVSVLKTIDPMVVFGSITYFHNFRRHFADLEEANFNQPGSVKIGNAIQFGAGVAYALNDRSSLNLSFTQRIVERTEIKRDCTGCQNQQIVSSQANVGIFNLGANFSLTDRLALIATFGIGVTEDAPDMSVGIRLPYRF